MKIPFYLEALYKSVIDIRWLQARRHDGVRAGKYFLGVILIIAIVNAIFLTRFTLSFLRDGTESLAAAAPDLVLQKKDGNIVASGIAEPFFYEKSIDGQVFLLYINTATSSAAVSTSSLVADKKSFLLAAFITNDRLRFIDGESGKEHVVLARDIPENGIIPTGKTFTQIADMVKQPRMYFVLGSFLTLVMFVFYGIAQAVYLAAIAFVAWIFVRIKQAAWTYSELFIVGMFAITLPLILGDILPLFGWYVPFIASAVWLGMLLGVVFKKTDESEKV